MNEIIKLLILDVDGVLTDGKLYYGTDGENLKVFHVHDGYGIKMLLKHGIQVAIISGRNSSMTATRLQELGISKFYLGVKDKNLVYTQIKQDLNIIDAEIAVMGDDIPDLVIMQQAGTSIAVANAVEEIKNIASWCTKKTGGNAAVREACEWIIKQSTVIL